MTTAKDKIRYYILELVLDYLLPIELKKIFLSSIEKYIEDNKEILENSSTNTELTVSGLQEKLNKLYN